MYSVTRLLDVAEDDRDYVLDAVRAGAAATGARRQIVAPTLPGSRNGGDILAHMRFDSLDQWNAAADDFAAALQDPAITRINGATYPGTPTRCGNDAGMVYRALFLRVQPGTHPDTVARFEGELSSMPRYISTIKAWQLSPVDDAVGDSQWTHVFEQEFSDVNGLLGLPPLTS
jgi:hypothetical protein